MSQTDLKFSMIKNQKEYSNYLVMVWYFTVMPIHNCNILWSSTEVTILLHYVNN